MAIIFHLPSIEKFARGLHSTLMTASATYGGSIRDPETAIAML